MKLFFRILKILLVVAMTAVFVVGIAGFIKFNIIADDVYNEKGERI
jgi:hypothetical protein